MANLNDELPLHFGWLLDVVGSPPPKVPVLLAKKGLKSHTAIVAQSGSGKSFALGRLLEEVVSRTRARVVILDPNSDFISFTEIESKVWKAKHLRPWLGTEDTLPAMRRRWGAVGIEVLTNRNLSDLRPTRRSARTSPVFLRWGELSLLDKADYLGLSVRENTPEVYAIAVASEIAQYNQELSEQKDAPYSLALFHDCISLVWELTLNYQRSSDRPKLPEKFNVTGVLPDAVARVDGRCYELNTYEMWDAESGTSLQEHMEALTEEGSRTRVVVIDLPSLPTAEGQLCVSSAVLNSLVRSARNNWAEAIKKPPEEDTRSPIFIVIDEAHNLAPLEPTNPRSRKVTEALITIAAEGRKYGLFLIVVTQRPSRLHPGILSQCDNLCLLRMNNRLDLQLVEKNFGFVPEGWANRALQFKVGDCLLSGNFVEQPVYAHVAPRRTVEGGRNLRDAHWLEDPLKNTSAGRRR